MTDWGNPREAQLEPEVMLARRAFAVSQQVWSGATVERVATAEPVGWHSTSVHPENGALAVVQPGSAFEGLVGEIVRVVRFLPTERREIRVYVVETAELPTGVGLSLARRAFLALAPLAHDTVAAQVEVVG